MSLKELFPYHIQSRGLGRISESSRGWEHKREALGAVFSITPGPEFLVFTDSFQFIWRPLYSSYVSIMYVYVCVCVCVCVQGWPKSPYGFFCKIKDTLFIVTSNFIDLDILSM